MPQRPDPGGGHLWRGLAALLSSLRELTQEKDLALLPHDPPKINILFKIDILVGGCLRSTTATLLPQFTS